MQDLPFVVDIGIALGWSMSTFAPQRGHPRRRDQSILQELSLTTPEYGQPRIARVADSLEQAQQGSNQTNQRQAIPYSSHP
jgi:hypothetical protein